MTVHALLGCDAGACATLQACGSMRVSLTDEFVAMSAPAAGLPYTCAHVSSLQLATGKPGLLRAELSSGAPDCLFQNTHTTQPL